MMKNYSTQIDVRPIQEADKDPIIIERFKALKQGETLEFINNDDPQELQDVFLHAQSGKFVWEYLEKGPYVWRIAITKR